MKHIRRVSVALALLAGCASQAAPDYEGEPLFSITGTVVNQLSSVPANTEVALDFPSDGTPDGTYWTEVPTTGVFPAAFTLDLYTPPPSDLLVGVGGGGSGSGTSALVAVIQVDSAGNAISTLGWLENYALVYVTEPTPLPTGGPPLDAGYHLIEEMWPPPTPDQIAQCTTELTRGTCTATDAAAFCAMEASQFVDVDADASGISLTEVPLDTPVSITLDGAPCFQFVTGPSTGPSL